MTTQIVETLTPERRRQLWTMLLALSLGFMLSQAFRTVAAMMAKPLQADFALSATQLGLFAATFHFMFGAMQLVMGIGIDLHGVRRTVLTAFPLAIVGSVVAAMAHSFPVVVLGQALIGVGCAPAFLVCTVFIARQFPAAQFAAVSGAVMGIGGVGMLITGTPLAWLVDAVSWRAGFLALGGAGVIAWLAVFVMLRVDPPPREGRESALQALKRFGGLFTMPHTIGIVLLASVTYASFITLRGLWLGPMLIERFGFTLVQSGNVAFAVSLAGLFGPVAFGRSKLMGTQRRRWIVGYSVAMALVFALIAFSHSSWINVGASLVIAFMCGYIVMQYADVRASYPQSMTGRALAVFTMAMFLGIAFMQWVTGLAASFAASHDIETFTAVNLSVAFMLCVGAAAFTLMPASPSLASEAAG